MRFANALLAGLDIKSEEDGAALRKVCVQVSKYPQATGVEAGPISTKHQIVQHGRSSTSWPRASCWRRYC
jgi:hypothetical protein